MTSRVDAAKRDSRRNAILTFGSVGLVGASLIFASVRLSSLRDEIGAAQQTLDGLNVEITERRRQVRELAPLAGAGLGYRQVDSIADADDLTESLQAHRALQRL
jgi:hypothetical protein